MKHIAKFRVYYEDTDAGGVVYYANFLKFAERARTDFLRESGYDHQRLAKEKNVFYVVKKAEIEYLAPGRLDDLIKVETIITKVGASSVEMSQNCFNQDDIKLADVKILIVCVTNEGEKIRSARIPEEVSNFFKNYL
ncbi:MAG: YbgC/FadM family acyl-CoA thioesterase [Rickettsiales bacterium]|nr:YbgC/FadM family acyl-CoA thioesterase [Rickettsiales bacterium]